MLLDHSEAQVGLQQVPVQRSEPASQPQPELLGTARPSRWARGYSRALGAMDAADHENPAARLRVRERRDLDRRPVR